MGIVEEVGAGVTAISPGDRVVIPFQVCCGTCWMCEHGLQSQCETTQVREQGTGAALFGYSELYGSVPGGQAEYLRVPQAQYTHIKVPDGPPDERFVYLSDVLPTAWQAVAYADPEPEGTLLVLGLGPIGDMACRIALAPRGAPGHRRRPRRRPAGPRPGPRRHHRRPARGRRRRRCGARPDRRPGGGCRDRRRRHGGARVARGRGRPQGRWRAPRRAGQEADDHRGHRPAGRGPHGHRRRCDGAARSR